VWNIKFAVCIYPFRKSRFPVNIVIIGTTLIREIRKVENIQVKRQIIVRIILQREKFAFINSPDRIFWKFIIVNTLRPAWVWFFVKNGWIDCVPWCYSPVITISQTGTRSCFRKHERLSLRCTCNGPGSNIGKRNSRFSSFKIIDVWSSGFADCAWMPGDKLCKFSVNSEFRRDFGTIKREFIKQLGN